jgi:hypothetical protein
MTRATITLTYDENKYMFEVLRLVTEQLKEGIQQGKMQRNGISAEYEQEIIVDYENIETRIENNCMIIKSKI